jgi:hypothetical protein
VLATALVLFQFELLARAANKVPRFRRRIILITLAMGNLTAGPPSSAMDLPLCVPSNLAISPSCEIPSRPLMKRKQGSGMLDVTIRAGNKRTKIMGRPRNAWTPSKSRKLVRLYLMTNLSVDEIAIVLRTKDFKPWWALPFFHTYSL